MPVVESSLVVPVPQTTAFDVSQTTGDVRLRWFVVLRTARRRLALLRGGGDADSTLVVWRYNFACRPRWLAPLAERIGTRVLQRDIDRRILRPWVLGPGGAGRGPPDVSR